MGLRGYFHPEDKRIDTIKYANWGSRPYEYRWVIDVIFRLGGDDMRVIDLGIGEPELHGWPEFFKVFFKPSLYVGIDCCPAMIEQGVDTPNFKLQQMNMTDLKYRDRLFNVGICISTFEHLESLSDLDKALKEAHRVLDPGSYFIVTMDEIWDSTIPQTEETYWSFLDSALKKQSYPFVDGVSFGINDLVQLAQPYFTPLSTNAVYKGNANQDILHNEFYNNAISYCIFKRV